MLLHRVSLVSVQHFHWSVFDILPSPTSLEVQFSPGQLHRFEYQTPIQSSSLGLFELHHAVRGRWAAEANGSWKYWVKILMEWSQSSSQPQPNCCALTCCLDTCRATFLLMCSCFRPKADKVNVWSTWFHTQTTKQTWVEGHGLQVVLQLLQHYRQETTAFIKCQMIIPTRKSICFCCFTVTSYETQTVITIIVQCIR